MVFILVIHSFSKIFLMMVSYFSLIEYYCLIPVDLVQINIYIRLLD